MTLDGLRLPLCAAVASRIQTKHTSFHVPGHKGSSSNNEALNKILAWKLQGDMTELPGLDNLSQPSGPIAASMRIARSQYDTQHTIFLVNGSTVGVLAAVGACCNHDSTLVASRTSHSSVFNAAAIAGCNLALVAPFVHPETQIPLGMTASCVEARLKVLESNGHRTTAVLVTSPTYQGIVSDIAAIAKVCTAHGSTLIVDEAHGAHLGLHPALPPSAIQQGADISIQSAHKTLSALTQTALLHVSHAVPDSTALRVQRLLRMLQTSSPSYVLMASLEAAICAAAVSSSWCEPLRAAADLRVALRDAGLPPLELGAEFKADWRVDPLRVTAQTSSWGLSGAEVYNCLDAAGVAAEMAEPQTITFALGHGSTRAMSSRAQSALLTGLAQLPSGWPVHSDRIQAVAPDHSSLEGDPSSQVLAMAHVLHSDVEEVSAASVIGRVSASNVTVYPPGVPVLVLGEVVHEHHLDMLTSAVSTGAHTTGCSPDLSAFLVVK